MGYLLVQFSFFFFVPNVLPQCSHQSSQNIPQALNVLPNMFPIAPQFLSQIVWP